MRLSPALVILTAAIAPAGGAFAADYYVAPPGTVQNCTADGSKACPWVGLSVALTNIRNAGVTMGGDRLLLLDGNYDGLALYNYSFAQTVVVQSLNGKNAHIEYITVKDGSQNLTFKNLSVWPSNPYTFYASNPYLSLISTYSTAANITFDGLDIRSGQDAINYMSWAQSEWLSRKINGAQLGGANNTLENSTLTGLYMGATIYANAAMINNTVDGFAGDAYRVLGDNSIVSGNLAKNCFQIDSNHADGLQSFNNPTNAGGANLMSNLTIRDNRFIEWTSSQSNPLKCSLQGIFFGDGPYDNITIENNLISVTRQNGIGIDGGQNVQILNNTVVNNAGIEGTFPYISINNNSGQVKNILVANNLTMAFSDLVGGVGVTYAGNSTLIGLRNLFQDISTYNYIPTSTSGFIDTGDTAYAPPTDILGALRPFGGGPDRGAYEVGSSTTSGSTSGGTTTGDGSTTGGSTSGGTTGTGDGSTTSGSTSDGSTTGSTTTIIDKAKWGAKFLKPPKK